MHELPLVFFTVLGQLAAGMVLISGLYCLKQNNESTVGIIERVNIAALVVMAIGMLIASFHLGQPLRAFNVIYGIGRSPMSNEIFTFGLLFGLTFLSTLLAYLNKRGKYISKFKQLHKWLAFILIIVSLFFVWTIVVTYMFPTVKNWDTWYTALQMYTTMLVLGGIATTMLGLRRMGMILFFLGVVIILTCKVPYINFIDTQTTLGQAQYLWWGIQCVLLILALLLALVNTCKGKKSTLIYVVAFLCVLIAELSGRIAFYNLWEIPL